jgi:hypothetical protein
MSSLVRSLGAYAAQRADALFKVTLLSLLSLLIGLNLLGDSLDRRAYLWQYQKTEDQGFLELISGLDPLYYVSLKLAWLGGIPFEWITIAIALASLWAIHAAVSQLTVSHGAFYALWASHVLWLHNYTQMRIGLALALVILAIYRLERGKWWVFGIAVGVHAAVVIPIGVWLAAKLPPRVLAVAAAVAAAVMFQLITDFEGVFNTLTTVMPDIAQRALLYVDLRDFDIFSEQNLLALMPMLQSAMGLYILTRTRRLDATALLGLVGPVFFYGFSFLPVLAIRTYEMFIPFFLIHLALHVQRSPLLMGLATIYGLIGLRQIFFSASPVISLGFSP